MAVGARSGRDEGEERPDDAVEREAEEDGDAQEHAHRSFWKELPLLIGIALLLALLIKTFLLQAFSIPSASMQNTLQMGDRVLVDKLTPWFGSEPERGEVVVFHDPADWLSGQPTPEPNLFQQVLSKIGLMPDASEKDLIKRVIAIGGDTVECKKGGPVVVNGKELDEPYIYPGNTPCDDAPFGPITVPKGKLWVMGDHRQNSEDSRYHQQDSTKGFVPVDKVVGRAVVVAWPVTRWATLPVPDTFDQPGIGNQAAATALGLGAAGLAPVGLGPAALGLVGAVPLVMWRRQKLTRGRTGG
ncbi:signal peptidase I [Streptomyces sp. NPDC058682]|uniref:signal peptidase I n=1 Tax=unclassified Streptomyces TaxID=2593676 RepID=UPI00225C0776|nr:signal peptidase I [Streptomyces sp. NBC_01214]MCX4806038.1 signal peptidase I [Streptomyces sp. NBC_01214]